MLPYRDSRITRIVLVVFFLLIAAYAYYEGRGLLYGPVIEVEDSSPVEVSDSFITIEGGTRRISALLLNGKSIPVTEDGDFSEGYVLAPGYNHITLSARDRWGKTTERVLEIIYTP